MAPSIAETTQETHQVSHEVPSKVESLKPTEKATPLVKPLKYSGSLDEYQSFDVTNVIGREFPEARLLDILKDDEKIRDLAITVSQRGVVFFRNQDITVEDQKILGQKLGELTGKPASSKVSPQEFKMKLECFS
jgi:hypothetical protein